MTRLVLVACIAIGCAPRGAPPPLPSATPLSAPALGHRFRAPVGAIVEVRLTAARPVTLPHWRADALDGDVVWLRGRLGVVHGDTLTLEVSTVATRAPSSRRAQVRHLPRGVQTLVVLRPSDEVRVLTRAPRRTTLVVLTVLLLPLVAIAAAIPET